MPVTLSKKAIEESTLVVTASFEDEEGSAVVPDSLKWSLVNRDGSVVNGRDNVEVTSLSSEVDIVLSGDDLAKDGPGEVERWIVLQATYTSTLGSGLPLKDQAAFYIVDLKSI